MYPFLKRDSLFVAIDDMGGTAMIYISPGRLLKQILWCMDRAMKRITRVINSHIEDIQKWLIDSIQKLLPNDCFFACCNTCGRRHSCLFCNKLKSHSCWDFRKIPLLFVIGKFFHYRGIFFWMAEHEIRKWHPDYLFYDVADCQRFCCMSFTKVLPPLL